MGVVVTLYFLDTIPVIGSFSQTRNQICSRFKFLLKFKIYFLSFFFFFSSSSSSSRGEVGEAYVNIDELERDGPVRPDTERPLRPRHTSHKTVFKTALRTQTYSHKFASHTCIKPGPDMHTETRLRVLYGCMHTGKGQRGFSTLKFTAGCLRLLENQVHPTHSPLLHFVFVPYRKK